MNSKLVSDDLNGVVVRYVDYSKMPEFESRVSHDSFQNVKHLTDNPIL
jgi:hypothetical protein